jgi:AcrR family transcriptional regulator
VRSSTRPRVRRTSSERRIIDATLALLRDDARLSDLSVEQILTAADISRSTFYSYFADKNELVMRLAEPLIEAYTAIADTWWGRDAQAGTTPTWHALAELNEEFIAVARTHREVFVALTSFGGTAADPGPLRTITDEYTQRMASRLDRERAEGLVSADVIPDVTARFIVTATFAAIRDHLDCDDDTNDVALARTLGHAFWFAMYGDRPTTL